MKKIFITIGIIVLVFLWLFFSARGDYLWSDLIINEKQKDGWVVAVTSNNLVDITRPWTIFKQPIIQIGFIKPKEIVWLDNEHILIKILWVNYENFSRTREEIFQNVIDCKNNRSAFVDDKVLVTEINLSKLDWIDSAPNTPGEQINKFICDLK